MEKDKGKGKPKGSLNSLPTAPRMLTKSQLQDILICDLREEGALFQVDKHAAICLRTKDQLQLAQTRVEMLGYRLKEQQTSLKQSKSVHAVSSKNGSEFRKKLGKSLGLEEGWGYHPDSGEIKLPEK